MRTNTKEIIKRLNKLGYKVQSYKPGSNRLYQVGIQIGNGGFKGISPYMTASELKMFYYGLLAGMGRPMTF